MVSCSKANATMTFFGARHIHPGTFFCLMTLFLLRQAISDADFALTCPAPGSGSASVCQWKAWSQERLSGLAKALVNKVCVSFH